MNVRKFLSDVRVLNNTIQKKQQRLDMLKAGLYPSLNMSADKIQNSSSEDQMADTIVEIADLSREINSDIDRYYNLTKKCIELIDLHSSARSREILVDIYINRYSLSQIGKTFHRTARQISNIRDKAINEIQHIVDK